MRVTRINESLRLVKEKLDRAGASSLAGGVMQALLSVSVSD
jgi:hypothetical protein